MRHMKLQGKILAAILGTMTLVLALLIGYVAFQANRSTMKSAQDMVAGMALATANAIDAEVEVPLDTARAMVMAIEALDREAPGARNQVLSVLENVLAETPWPCPPGSSSNPTPSTARTDRSPAGTGTRKRGGSWPPS